MDRRMFLTQSLGTSGLVLSSWLAMGGRDARSLAWSAPANSKIAWQTDLYESHEAAVKKNRPVLIVFTASWCAYCHKLVKEVTADAPLTSLINEKFVPTLLDFDKEAKVAKVLEVEVLPTTVILSPQVDLLLFKAGYMKTDAYQKLLQEALNKPA